MARKPKITRTIWTTEVTVLQINTTTAKTSQASYTLPRTYESEEKALKMIEKLGLVTDKDIRAVYVIEMKSTSNLYEMTEETFIANSTIVSSQEPAIETEKPKKQTKKGGK